MATQVFDKGLFSTWMQLHTKMDVGTLFICFYFFELSSLQTCLNERMEGRGVFAILPIHFVMGENVLSMQHWHPYGNMTAL